MKIGLLHLNLSLGSEAKNLKILAQAIELASKKGAKWLITPETAVQGYYFYRQNPNSKIEPQPSAKLEQIQTIVKQYQLTLFLGTSEYVKEQACNFNTCLVIGNNGEVIGRHRKLISHATGAEAWATRASCLEPISVSQEFKVGALVCADAWYPEHGKILRDKGAKILVNIAAWPPTETCGNPLTAWQRCSLEAELPLILCNQTGENPWMNMTQAQSVVIENGEVKLTHSGEEKILLFDWDFEKNCLISTAYEKIEFKYKG